MSNPRTPSKSSFSSAAFGGQEVLLPLRVRTNPPPPDQWTRVREYSIEERDAYENWKYGVSTQLQCLKRQMESYSHTIEALDRDIEEAKERKLQYSYRHENQGEGEEEEEDDSMDIAFAQNHREAHKQIINRRQVTSTSTQTTN